MGRMTNRTSDGTAYVRSETGQDGVGNFTTQRRLPDIISKLAAYEDTGLTPWECNFYAKCKAQHVSRREFKLSKENDLLERKLNEDGAIKYVVLYHDKRGLYEDVLIVVTDEVDDGSLERNFIRCPDEIVRGAYAFDDDGWWELKLIKQINSIPKISYIK